jgi:MoxR-like ATPase
MSRGWDIAPPAKKHKYRERARPAPTASEVVAKLEKSGAVVLPPEAPLARRDTLCSALAEAAAKQLSALDAAAVLEEVAALPERFPLASLNRRRLGELMPSETLVHPEFVKAAAKSGRVFCLFDGATVQLHKISGEEIPRVKPDGIDTAGIQPDFYWKPRWADYLKLFVDRGDPVLLLGPAGSGKTEAVERVFAERRQRLYVVSCNARMTADDLEGRVDLVIDGSHQVTKFSPAAPALASADGAGLLLDEADAALPEAMYSVYRLLEGKPMHILRKGADCAVPRHQDFRIVGTQNTEGRGDEKNLYHGRSFQDEAFLDRWGNAIRVDYPEPEIEQKILQRRTGIQEQPAKRIVDTACALRAALSQDEIAFCCSVRRTLRVAANIAAGFPPELAWRFAVIYKSTQDDARKIYEILGRVYGSTLTG